MKRSYAHMVQKHKLTQTNVQASTNYHVVRIDDEKRNMWKSHVATESYGSDNQSDTHRIPRTTREMSAVQSHMPRAQTICTAQQQ